MLVMGIYGPPEGGEDAKNATFFEEEVFEVLDNETYDNVVIVGDWNVFLDTEKDQKNYSKPGRYRPKTREEIKQKLRAHNLVDIYREQHPKGREFTYKDKTGTNTSSRLDYFIVDQEVAINTTKTEIESIADQYDHSEITMTVDFDKIMRGPGFWKSNNSHLENQYLKKMIRNELRILVHENQTDEENKTLGELLAMSPENLQKIGLRLNPHELMEQIHYRLNERIITYSKIKQEERKREKFRVESSINEVKEELKQNTLGEN
jgi:hypothetical protein